MKAFIDRYPEMFRILSCPDCNNTGSFRIQTDFDEWEIQQCEFCYEEPMSVFSRNLFLITDIERFWDHLLKVPEIPNDYVW